MFCTSCGNEVNGSPDFCTTCGLSLKKKGDKGKSLECPNCHRLDSVQKVSSIVKSGTSETSLKGDGQAVAYSFGDDGLSVGGGRFKASGTQITTLSKQLARPNLEPQRKSGVLGCLFSISITVASFSFLFLFPSATMESFGTFLVLAAIAVALFFPFNRERIRYAAYLQDFQVAAGAAVDRWSDLYYCHRCDGIFVPGAALGSSDRMLDYIRFPNNWQNDF